MELVQADFSFIVFFGLAILIASVAAAYYLSMYREDPANLRLDGSYRVIRCANKMFYVQKFVNDVPDPAYYPCSLSKRWHWKFLAGYSFKESAIQYMERELANDKAERKALIDRQEAENERLQGLSVAKIVEEPRKCE